MVRTQARPALIQGRFIYHTKSCAIKTACEYNIIRPSYIGYKAQSYTDSSKYNIIRPSYIGYKAQSYTDTSKYNIIRPSYIGYKAQSYIDSGAGWHLHMHTRPKYRQKRVCTGTRARTHSPTHPHTHPSIHTQTRTHAPPPPHPSIHTPIHPSTRTHALTHTHSHTVPVRYHKLMNVPIHCCCCK